MFSVNLQNSRERLNEAGDLPKWVVEQSRLGALSKIYQHLAGANFEPEGEMMVGRLPWHRRGSRWPETEGRWMCALYQPPWTNSHSKAGAPTLATFCRFVKVSPSISRLILLPRGNNTLTVWERNELYSEVHCGLILGALGGLHGKKNTCRAH